MTLIDKLVAAFDIVFEAAFAACCLSVFVYITIEVWHLILMP
jgi:hypothetical protein